MTYDKLCLRYPKFRWGYSVEKGFYAEVTNPFSGKRVFLVQSGWGLEFGEYPLLFLDRLHDALSRIELQDRTMRLQHWNITTEEPE